jgi:hypothetical protein
VGFSEGTVLLIDIEFGHTFEKSLKEVLKEESQSVSVDQLWWLSLPKNSSDSSQSSSCYSFENMKMEEIFENESGGGVGIHSSTNLGSNEDKSGGLERVFQFLENSVLVALLSNKVLFVLAYGMEVIWRTDLSNQLSNYTFSSSSSSSSQLEPLIVENRFLLSMNDFSAPSSAHPLSLMVLSDSFLLSVTPELRRLSYLSLLLANQQKKLEEILHNLTKRWKDCLKTLPPKISLLQSLLSGYELRMTPVEFLHSITLSGLWHPAALTAFSQHWNDQGITRLRAAVDSTSKYVIRCLQFKVNPLVMNILFLIK